MARSKQMFGMVQGNELGKRMNEVCFCSNERGKGGEELETYKLGKDG